MTPPIPRRLLTSTAVVRTRVEGGYGGEFEAPRTIRGVCYQPVDAARRTDWQIRDAPTGVLFVPSASPGAFAIPPGSMVSVDGGPESCVGTCDELSVGGRVHHWEVELR